MSEDISWRITYQFWVQANMSVQVLLSGLVFFHPLQKKRRYVLWLLLALLCCAGIFAGSVMMRIQWNNLATRFIMRLFQFAMPLLTVLLCYRAAFYVKLKVWCAGIAAMEIGAAAYSFLLALRKIDERVTISLIAPDRSPGPLDWSLYYALHLLVYWAVYRLFGPRRTEEQDRESRLSTILLTLFCLLFLTVPDCVSNEYRSMGYAMLLVNRIYLLALSAFILVLCNGIEIQSQYRMEMAIMERVLSEDKKQYRQMKENIDIINMHCHDLKHQLENFSGKLTDREIASLRDAMEIYDRNIKTGNEALDVVLYMSRLACEKEGIELTCLADGHLLSFMRTSHVYALFNNALGNAMEAVRKVSDPEMRTISLTVRSCDGQVEIEVTNYFDASVSGRLPMGESTKADQAHHGYGLSSMRYVARQYGGTMAVHTEKNIFSLLIGLPFPATVRRMP